MVTHFEDFSDGANKVRVEDQEEEGLEEGSFYEQIDKIFVEKSWSVVCFYGRIDKYLKNAGNPKRKIPDWECGDVGQSLGRASNSYCSGGGAQESDGENDTFSYSFLIPT